MAKRIEFTARLVANKALAEGQRLLTFACPEVAATARPGQFAALATKTFLRRPLGICRVDREAGLFAVGGRAKGPGMAALLTLEPGAEVSVLAPLGKGFDWQPGDTIIACGGGTGVFPLYFLMAEARAAGCRTAVALGFRDRQQAILQREFAAVTDRCLYAAETGGLDLTGTAVTALDVLLKEFAVPKAADDKARPGRVHLVACGPTPMMQAAAGRAQAAGLPCQVSLEERMACGVGLCLGCACAVKDRSERGSHYVRCCKEGPVFRADEVVWE